MHFNSKAQGESEDAVLDACTAGGRSLVLPPPPAQKVGEAAMTGALPAEGSTGSGLIAALGAAAVFAMTPWVQEASGPLL